MREKTSPTNAHTNPDKVARSVMSATHRDECSCSPVNTSRTARSRTSFEYSGRLLIS